VSIPDLLAAYAAILQELRDRGVVRTRNAPLGDYAEYLVAEVYGGELAANSVKSLPQHGVTDQREGFCVARLRSRLCRFGVREAWPGASSAS